MILKELRKIALVSNKNRIVTAQDFVDSFRRLGIKKGDTICVHSQIFSLGKPMLDKRDFLAMIIELLKYVVGEDGTLLMPAFSYSFCKDEVFHVNETPSDVGILTEAFRQCPDTKRTRHPIFSFSVWGRRTQEFVNIPITSFTDESVYGIMKEGNDKLVFLGAPLGFTFYYLAEESAQVSHRYYKNFSGIIEQNGICNKVTVPYYVRKLKQKSTESERKINDFLLLNKLEKSESIGKGSITVVETKEAYDAIVQVLKKNSTFFLRDIENIL